MSNIKPEYESGSVLDKGFLIIFLAMGLFMFYMGIGNLTIDREGSIYFIIFSLFVSILCFLGLWSIKNKVLNTFLAVLVIPLIVGGVFAQKNIQDIYVSKAYASVDNLMIKSYAGIVDTPSYQAFLIDKNNNNVSKIIEYKRNIDNYLSIESEKVMQLKLFYTMTNNKDIHSQLDKVFDDGLVNKIEYEQFKTFVYQLPLNTNEQAMFTMIQN